MSCRTPGTCTPLGPSGSWCELWEPPTRQNPDCTARTCRVFLPYETWHAVLDDLISCRPYYRTGTCTAGHCPPLQGTVGKPGEGSGMGWGRSQWWGLVPAGGCQAEVGYSLTLWLCWFFGETYASSAASFWSERRCVRAYMHWGEPSLIK